MDEVTPTFQAAGRSPKYQPDVAHSVDFLMPRAKDASEARTFRIHSWLYAPYGECRADEVRGGILLESLKICPPSKFAYSGSHRVIFKGSLEGTPFAIAVEERHEPATVYAGEKVIIISRDLYLLHRFYKMPHEEIMDILGAMFFTSTSTPLYFYSEYRNDYAEYFGKDAMDVFEVSFDRSDVLDSCEMSE